MKLTKKDIPYFAAAAVVVYSISIAALYVIIWILGLVFTLPEIPTILVLLCGAALTTLAYISDPDLNS